MALTINEKLYPEATHPRGHPALAGSYDNFGLMLFGLGDSDKQGK